MQRAFRLVKRIFLILTLLMLLAIPIVGLISTAVNWHGVCYGFTDGQSPCTWWEFARNEMFWGTFIFIPFFFLASLAYLGMALAEWVHGLLPKHKDNSPHIKP